MESDRDRPGELRGFFNDWEVLWDYEGRAGESTAFLLGADEHRIGFYLSP